MPRASQVNTISDKELGELLKRLAVFLSSYNDSTALLSFLKELLTHEEQIMLGKRLQIFQLLENGFSVDELKEALQISYETARSYKFRYEVKSEKFKHDIKNSLPPKPPSGTLKKVDNFFNAVLDSKRDMKARSKLYNSDFDEKPS